MLTKKQILEAESTAANLPELTDSARVPMPATDKGLRKAAPAPATPHQNTATALLRDMFDRNLKLVTRMMDIGDCSSAKRLLQSAISQCDQIASYGNVPSAGQPQTKPTTDIEV